MRRADVAWVNKLVHDPHHCLNPLALTLVIALNCILLLSGAASISVCESAEEVWRCLVSLSIFLNIHTVGFRTQWVKML